MPIECIYHIVKASDIKLNIDRKYYKPKSIENDGFIHCSIESSVIPVANDYYRNENVAFLLLKIDPAKLTSEVKYEKAAPLKGMKTDHLKSAPVFPHIYGPIDTQAIIGIGELKKNNKEYIWPKGFVSIDEYIGK